MTIFLNSHLYLFSLVIWTVIYLSGLIILRKHARIILLSSILALPQAFLGKIVVPDYWHPESIPFLGVGLEDFIFSFFSGGIVWMGVLILSPGARDSRIQPSLFLQRVSFCLIFGVIVVSVLYLTGVRGIMNPFLTMVLWFILIFLYRSVYWEIAVVGALFMLVLHPLALKIGFLVFPDLLQMWSRNNFTHFSVLKVPLGELIWAFMYGGAWSASVAFFLDLNPKRTGQFLPRIIGTNLARKI